MDWQGGEIGCVCFNMECLVGFFLFPYFKENQYKIDEIKSNHILKLKTVDLEVRGCETLRIYIRTHHSTETNLICFPLVVSSFWSFPAAKPPPAPPPPPGELGFPKITCVTDLRASIVAMEAPCVQR